MQTLFAPWRHSYITQSKEAAAECFFCAAARRPDDPESLVVWTAGHHLVMLNRHPYTSGHLMVAPLAHGTARARLRELFSREEALGRTDA